MTDHTTRRTTSPDERYSVARRVAWFYTAACAFVGVAAAVGTPTHLAWLGAIGWLLIFAATCFTWSVFGAHMHEKHHRIVERNGWDDMPCHICDPNFDRLTEQPTSDGEECL